MASTKKPTGLTIARNGWKYTFSWKIADSDYGSGQTLQYRVNSKAWQTLTVGNTATTKSVSLTAGSYYPAGKTKISSVSFRVRGKRRPTTKDGKTTTYDWSDYSSASFSLSEPAAPTITAELTQSNVTEFSWDASGTDKKPLTNVEWQSIRVKASDVTNGADLRWTTSNAGWATGTGSASDSITRTEDSTLLAKDSYTRWVRVRSRGPAGASAWRYAKHVYATPYAPVVKSGKATEKGTSTAVTMSWTAKANASHPIDYAQAQYKIGTPAAGMAAPSGSWSIGGTVKDTTGTDAASFLVEDLVGLDECLWVRAAAFHDANVAGSSAYLVKKGKLKAPTGLTVSTDSSTYRATITAQNASAVPDSAIAVRFQNGSAKPFIVGIIPAGQTSITVQCPAWSGAVAFGVAAFQGSYTYTTEDGVSRFTVTANMKSDTVWDGGSVPLAPSAVTADMTDTEGEVLVTWDWPWTSATQAEVSWAQDSNAWESTVQPATYILENIYASNLRVAGLAMGLTWYFRVRLGTATTWGPYSETMAVDLSSAPSAPVLTLSEAVIPEDGTVTASWAYISTDGTAQAAAEVCEVTVDGDTITYGAILAQAATAQSSVIAAEDAGWTTGESYYLAVRVTSESGRVSAWSDPVPVQIADPVTAAITQSSLVSMIIDDGDGGTRTITALTAMPLTVTVAGAGAGGTTAVIIERAETYIMERPDESQFNGYEGETIYLFSQTGEDQITIDREDLIGILDDGAPYRLIATVSDSYGQSAEASISFEVRWAHQAVIPEGTAEISGTIAVITPTAPTGYLAGDTCDIYRLSADRPMLIVEGGEFGESYVDPFPTVGEPGGYRLVYKTADGDYITDDDTMAWLDLPAGITEQLTIIDFGGRQVILELDMATAHSWEKDFTETTYLGGSVQGDWNLSTHRSTSVTADTVVIDDPDLIADMRRLAVYPGICHVRTVDGSTFTADVQVSENRTYSQAGKVAAFTVTIRQVEPEQLDGVLLEEWEG